MDLPVQAAPPVVGYDAAALKDLDDLYAERQSANTRQTYGAAWRSFTAWCAGASRQALPASPETVALYFRQLAAKRTMTTVRTYAAAIADRHTQAELDNPCQHHAVKGALRGMKRRKAKETPKQARGATADDVAIVLERLGTSAIELRAKAMLAVARTTLARRSELVALDWDDIDRAACIISVYRQKTDNWTDAAMTPGACKALNDWLDYLTGEGVHNDAVFRRIDRHGNIGARLSAASVTDVFRQAYSQAELDPAGISGHSARVGTVQDLTSAGADVAAIAIAGGWTGTAMPVRYGSKSDAKNSPVSRLLHV